MIGIPTHAARDVEQDFRHPHHHRGNLVDDRLGGVEVAGIEAQQLAAGGRVAEVELVRTGDVRLGADAEQLGLDCVEVVRKRFGEDFIECGGQPLAWCHAVGGDVLEAVGNPDVGDRRGAERLAEGVADLAAALRVFDPEPAHAGVAVGQGEAVGSQRVGEAGGVEIETQPVLFRPIDPPLEVGDLDLVAVDLLAAELAVDGVDVEAVFAGQQRVDQFKVGAQFLRVAGLAGVIAGHRQPAAEFGNGLLEAGDVVALPAMQRNRHGGESCEGGFGIDPEGGVLFASQ